MCSILVSLSVVLVPSLVNWFNCYNPAWWPATVSSLPRPTWERSYSQLGGHIS